MPINQNRIEYGPWWAWLAYVVILSLGFIELVLNK